jgi:hypothetical protein
MENQEVSSNLIGNTKLPAGIKKAVMEARYMRPMRLWSVERTQESNPFSSRYGTDKVWSHEQCDLL